MFNCISNQKNTTLSYNEIPFCSPPKMLRCQVLRMFSSGNVCTYCWECKLERTLALSNNVNAEHTLCSRNSSSKNTFSGKSSHVHQETCTTMFMEALLSTANYPAGTYSNVHQQEEG